MQLEYGIIGLGGEWIPEALWEQKVLLGTFMEEKWTQQHDRKNRRNTRKKELAGPEGGTGEAGMYTRPGEGFPHGLLLRLFVGPYTSMCVDTQTQLGMAGAGMRVEGEGERSPASPWCKDAPSLSR